MITITTTIHDPDAGLKWLSELHVASLLKVCDSLIVVATPATNPQYLDRLTAQGCTVFRASKNIPGRVYYEAVRRGYETGAERIMYCDFDRLLHWVHTFPDDLKRMPRRLSGDMTFVERLPEDYKAHHEALYETEQLANKVLSYRLGKKECHDHLSGCFLLSRRAAKIVVRYPTDGYQFYGWWPMKVRAAKLKVSYRSSPGLAWETPDRFQKEIAKAGGLAPWREQLSSKEEWKKRVIMAREFVEKCL